MARKWLKRLVITLLVAPIALVLTLIILLYIPPIQDILRGKVASYASNASGMDISVERIRLHFPLRLAITGIEVVDKPDTILVMDNLSASVQLLPLFSGNVQLDHLVLNHLKLNTAALIDGMTLRGELGKLAMESHGINLSNEKALINFIDLSDTHLTVSLGESTKEEPEETATEPVSWHFLLEQIRLSNVSFELLMPLDSMQMYTKLPEATLNNVEVGLRESLYALEHLMLKNASLEYHTGHETAVSGFDPSHVVLRNIQMEVDSVQIVEPRMSAVLRQFSFEERSGLSLLSLKTALSVDSSHINLPYLQLLTPHSELNMAASFALADLAGKGERDSYARLDARIAKQDVLLFAGEQPDAFRKLYPSHAMVAHVTAEGDVKQLRISQLSLNLPGAFSLSGQGNIEHLNDSLKRMGSVGIRLETGRLDFLSALAGLPNDSSFVIPENIRADLDAKIDGMKYHALLTLHEQEGVVRADATFNSLTEVYAADLRVENFRVDHFLPKDSIRSLALTANIKGRGIDFNSPRASADVQLSLDQLEYGAYKIDSIALGGNLARRIVSANLRSDNVALKFNAKGNYALDKSYTQAQVAVDVERLDLSRIGLLPELKVKPLALHMDADLSKDTVKVNFNTGDLNFRMRAAGPLETLMTKSEAFTNVLLQQIKEKELNHVELRRALPTALVRLDIGADNILSYYLKQQNIAYSAVKADFVATPRIGINGRASILALKYDTLQLDTLFFLTKQDTARLAFRAGVVNNPNNPQVSFKALLTGEIRTGDADITMEYENKEGEKGLLLGVNARLMQNRTLFTFIPDEPIIAFHPFKFNGHNRLYVTKDLRVMADVDILDEQGMGVRIHSQEERDSTYLQNLDIEIRKIQLADVSRMLPYLPELSGEFFLEANVKKTVEQLQVSTEGRVDALMFDGKGVGDVGFGVTWMPGELGKQYLNGYLSSEEQEVMTLDGTYLIPSDELSADAALNRFPLKLANIFMPEGLLELSGFLNGELAITGKAASPVANGQLVLDDVRMISQQYGFNFRFDNNPVQLRESRLTFDKFAVYSTNDNPFTIDGYVDMLNLSQPMFNLSLQARNYQLLRASRARDRMLYGNALINMNATVKGTLNALVMRGNVNLLSGTDVTYVMLDSPLSVQDRLGELVQFTSFSDTLSAQKESENLISLTGIDMLMTISISEAARINVDLSPDQSSRVSLEGGGNLSFQYTPQGDMVLTGRYTLTGGTVKYSLPVIPLKEFEIDRGSFVQWSGNPMNPTLSLKATERVRASVPNDDGNGSRMVNFDVSIQVKNTLKDLELIFNLEAPDDSRVQEQLAAMDAAERSKQAVALMATGIYLAGGQSNDNFNMGSALNSILQSQIAGIAGSALKTVNISFDMENVNEGDNNTRTDYNFSYSQRFFNDRVKVVIGGTISSGSSQKQSNTFIDNVSLEYRLDSSGTRYIRIYHNKEYENILESDITETGVGLILRKRVNRLGDLFIFKKKKDEE